MKSMGMAIPKKPKDIDGQKRFGWNMTQMQINKVHFVSKNINITDINYT